MTSGHHDAFGLAAHDGSKAETGTPMLEMTDVCKSFGVVRALKGVSFEVHAGEVHGLIGENGAGKSTLMAVASGALKPDSGFVRIDGQHLVADASRTRDLGLAIVRQHPALFPELTVANNLLFSLSAKDQKGIRDPTAWAEECLSAWDDRPDIDPRARVGTLNPEQKFVLEISRAIYPRPRVLILDEPSEHLGGDGVERLFSTVLDLARSGTAVVYISHRIREIREISERVTVLRDGNHMGTYPTEELSEAEIVKLVIGRSLDATYPLKPEASSFEGVDPNLVVRGLSGAVFSGVDFSIRPREIVGFAGIDGNGQAEIARALAGLQKSSGSVEIAGRGVSVRTSRAATKHGITYISADRQKESIFSELSIRFNTTLRGIDRFARAGFVSGGAEADAGKAALEKYEVKLGSPEDPISSLSGGNQQKVVIAGALLTLPSVLIADQPTQGVDVGAKVEIYRHLRHVADQGASVLVLSSDNRELAGICDRVHIVSRGQLTSSVEGSHLSEERITEGVLRAESHREHRRQRPSVWSRLLDHEWAPVPVLVVLVIGLALFTQTSNPAYLSDINVRSVLQFAGILAIVSVGQSLVMMRGSIDLSVGPLMSMVLVTASYYVIDGVPLTYHVVGWGLILLICVATGVANWALINRLAIHPVLATFATWMVLEAFALLLRPVSGGLISSGTYELFSTRFGVIPIAFVIAVVVAVGFEAWKGRSLVAKRILAAGNDPVTSKVIGISPTRTALLAHVGCSLMAGLAGLMLLGRVGTGDPVAGAPYTLQAVSVAVIAGVSLFGGRGSFIAGLVAAVLMTQIRSVTSFLNIRDAWQDIFMATVTIVAVFIYGVIRRRPS
jgi:ribose transport system ATP-binding protein